MFNIARMLTNTINHFKVQVCLSLLHLSAKSVCLFKSVSNLMMEIYLLSENFEVVLVDLFLLSDLNGCLAIEILNDSLSL